MKVCLPKFLRTLAVFFSIQQTGLIHTTLLALPHMDKSQHGRGGVICNIGSVYGLEPAPATPVYSAAKHGVVGWTRSLAVCTYLIIRIFLDFKLIG